MPWTRLVILPDVNILVYAHRRDMQDHAAYRDWLESRVNAEAAFGLSDLVVSGFNPRRDAPEGVPHADHAGRCAGVRIAASAPTQPDFRGAR